MIKVYAPEILYNKYNKEEGDKPISATTKTTENSHGGDEVTNSVNDTRYATTGQPKEESTQQQNDQQQNNNQQPNSSPQQNNSQQPEEGQPNSCQCSQQGGQQNNNQQEQGNSQQNSNNGSSDVNQNDKGETTNNNNNDTQQSNNSSQSNNTEQQKGETTNNNDNTQQDNKEGDDTTTQQQENQNEQQDNNTQNNLTENEVQRNVDQNDKGETTTQQQDNNTQSDLTENEGQQDNDNSEDDTYTVEDEENYSDEEDDEQQQSGQYNNTEVVDINGLNLLRQMYLKLYRLVEYLSDEEKTPTTVLGENLVLNVKRLMLRQYERKPLSSYYYYRSRTQVILLLDNSGSMEWLMNELNTFFIAAIKRKDVQIYIAPNGGIVKYYDYKHRRFIRIYHDEAMNDIIRSGLPVIYFGDFDGANTPIQLSWTNKVYWICPEDRYKYFRQHDWVNYDEDDFKGFFGRALDDNEIIKVLELFAKNINKQRFWYDDHTEEEFEDEEEY